MITNYILQSAVNFPVAMWINSPMSSYQGCSSLVPFELFLFTEDNNEHTVQLYSQGSRSMPWQEPQNKWSHLNPQWRFTDINGNVVHELKLSNSILTTAFGTTGYIASAQFYYIDDLPTQVCGTILLWAVTDFSNYPVYKDIANNSDNVEGYSNSKVVAVSPHVVKEIIPARLEVTRNGRDPMFDFYWVDAIIPHIVTVVGDSPDGMGSPILKNIPPLNSYGLSGGNIIRSINALPLTSVTWTPTNSTAQLSSTDLQNFNIGGYLRSNVITNTPINSATISAEVSVYFEDIPDQMPYLWISNPENNTINRIYAPCISSIYISDDMLTTLEFPQSAIDVLYLQVTSPNIMGVSGFHGIYGIAVDVDKSFWATDAESDKVYKFSSNGVLLSTYNFGDGSSWYDPLNRYSGGCTPAGIALDGVSGVWITFFDSNAVGYINKNTGTFTKKIDLPDDYTSLYNAASVTITVAAPSVSTVNVPLPITLFTGKSYKINYTVSRSNGNDFCFSSVAPECVTINIGGINYYTFVFENSIESGTITVVPSTDTSDIDFTVCIASGSAVVTYTQFDITEVPYIDPLFKPVLAEPDLNNNIWVTYNNTLCCALYKYTSAGNMITSISLPTCSNPMDIYITPNNNVWVSLTYQSGPPFNLGQLRKYDTSYSLVCVISATNPGYITLTNDESLWFTQSGNTVTRVTTAGDINNWLVGSPPSNYLYEGALEGICCDVYNRVFVINSIDNKVYPIIEEKLYPGIKITPDYNIMQYNDNSTTSTYTLTAANNKSIQAFGDWSGYRWLKKYSNTTITNIICTTFLSGTSIPFNIYDFKGYDFRRFNESWDATNRITDNIRQTHIKDNPVFWNSYMDALWGNEASEQGKAFGREAYERIANFGANHIDINTCNIAQLYSLAHNTDVPIDEYGFEMPTDLRRIMDVASINQQLLWGNRCECNKNITNTYTTYVSNGVSGDFIILEKEALCESCGHYHAGNRGKLFDPETYMVTANIPFIIEDRANNKNKYQLIIPPPSCIYVPSNNLLGDSCVYNTITTQCLTTYPLSSLYMALLPEVFNFSISANWDEFQQIITYFCFFDYYGTNCKKQIGGVINWDDKYTTLDETVSSIDSWYGSGQNLERMLNYTLYKGLDLISE